MNKSDYIFAGVGIGLFLVIMKLGKTVIVPAVSEAIENVGSGMDNLADYHVKKEMAWNEIGQADGLVETYNAYMDYLGF